MPSSVEDAPDGSYQSEKKMRETTSTNPVESDYGEEPPQRTLKRQLKNRHIAMIRYVGGCFTTFQLVLNGLRHTSIGGVIGTGCEAFHPI